MRRPRLQLYLDRYSAFVADRGGTWREVLCIREERVVGNDNTVLQIPPVSRCVRTWSGRRSASTNTRTVSWRSSGDRIDLAAYDAARTPIVDHAQGA